VLLLHHNVLFAAILQDMQKTIQNLIYEIYQLAKDITIIDGV